MKKERVSSEETILYMPRAGYELGVFKKVKGQRGWSRVREGKK